MNFGELRSALHSKPSQEAWARLVELLEQLDDTPPHEVEQALEYVIPHLDSHWPDRLRIVPAPWITSLQGLQNTDLDHVYYSAPAPHIEYLVPLARRLVINHDYKLMGASDIDALLSLGHLSHLTHVDVSRFSFSRSDALALTKLINAGRIRGVHLERIFPSYRNNVSADPSRAFFDTLEPDQGQLEHLALVDLSLTVNDLSDFLRKHALEGLKHLDVSKNILTDPFIELLLRAPCARTLESLALSQNFFSGEGLALLAEEGAFPSLREVTVRELPLTHETEDALATSGASGGGVEVIRFDAPIALKARLSKRGGLDREIYLPAHTTIGRGKTSTLILHADSISRHHASLIYEDGAVMLEDHSTGGVYIDATYADWRHVIEPDMRVAIGHFILTGIEPIPL